MRSSYQLTYFLLSISTLASANPPKARALQFLQLPSVSNESSLTNASLQTVSSGSLSTDPDPICSAEGTAYDPLPLNSCRQAIDSIVDDPTQFSIGKKGQGIFAATVPWQVLSRKSVFSRIFILFAQYLVIKLGLDMFVH